MSTLNKAMIIGRLGADPDIRYTQNNTAIANMSVATSEKFKDKNGEQQERTEWHRLVAWGRLAEISQEYLKKGALIYVEGPIQTRSWENKEGVKQYTTEIKVLQMQMLNTKQEGGNQEQQQNEPGAAKQKPAQEDPSAAGNVEPDVDDDLPF